ncbi:23S rRNA (guanosine2251-2'-O)-methyltransferase [Entomoplasma freundtii]|uniref:23S rRNA (Guanosine2251-2'-O)-methyltransferase n=1 Tax=Entomoplasma freundtii TaxID=74700 RepID=A0A2K8NSB2_9MOLU|nr:23S rRNA (guanosine(2251)-2'-O)-methyltransferase RlmB [Entomoplasma freundtii]ATZ16699.1 23S rRNA (guanosine2251-2'-O)-methyltransferase [Entomoplasma freundtii]TDY58134.1 23S rRNA (guanosine2251-2'-O)-methyltransferase [Entomoplasma freundtii]
MAMNLIYGNQPVQDFLLKRPQLIRKIWTKDPEVWLARIQKTGRKITVNKLNPIELGKLAGKEANHQGVVAEIQEFQYFPAIELWKQLPQRDKDLVLVLDQIHDPHNFGAIIRSACLFGVQNIIMLNRHQVEVTPTVVKTSAGTAFDVKITKVANLYQALETLKENGYWIYASNLNQEAQDLRNVDFAAKTVLVVGNEGDGIRPLLTKASDFNVYIPIRPEIDSLNVSTATAIMLFAIATQLKLV